MSSRPIGVFDSGIGGLTVAAEVVRALPEEDIVYLGDTARLPYGSKSPDVVTRYAERCAQFLLSHDIKLLVIACNTASAFALEHLQKTLSVPVLGVIEPGAKRAVSLSHSGRIGVIGTHGTVRSGVYARAIRSLRGDAAVSEHACPLFVPLAEEGWEDHAAARLIAETYLAPLRGADIDTLVLGCTHYPVLKRIISEVVGPKVALCDSAISMADAVKAALGTSRAAPGRKGNRRFFLTDVQPSFAAVANRFFGADLGTVERVDLAT